MPFPADAPTTSQSDDSTSVARPAGGHHPPKSSRMASLNDKVREKQKRSRVTPVQLAQLEQFFAADPSPTATRRKEISEVLGMPERQTQIWFQNRRAKAKLQNNKPKSKIADTQAAEKPLSLSNVYDINFDHTVRDETPVRVIPCTSLTIGTWRRIAAEKACPDLIAYISESKQSLTWFLRSDRWALKMAIPFRKISRITFVDDKAGSAILSFHLSGPPHFYLYDNALCGWKSCSDWTEGCQATSILQHDLSGEALELGSVRQYILQANYAAFDVPPPPRPVYHTSPSAFDHPQGSTGFDRGNREENGALSVERSQYDKFAVENYGPSTMSQRASHVMRPQHHRAFNDLSLAGYSTQDIMISRHRSFRAECPDDGHEHRPVQHDEMHSSGFHFTMEPPRHPEHYTRRL
ncbi:hypothetical protein APHAL10511_004558 [Amanita phalloides]|nr:hypothetical protein APHAL10511_004558 [Amanita phalloides]